MRIRNLLLPVMALSLGCATAGHGTIQGKPTSEIPEVELADPSMVCAKLSAPTVVRRVEPELTAEIRRAYDHGSAIARVRVGSGGEVRGVEIVKASPQQFGAATKEAVLRWRYSPALCDGEAVEVIVRVSSRFRVYN